MPRHTGTNRDSVPMFREVRPFSSMLHQPRQTRRRITLGAERKIVSRAEFLISDTFRQKLVASAHRGPSKRKMPRLT